MPESKSATATKESPALSLPKAAVCFHILEEGQPAAGDAAAYPDCPVMRSMELDLLAYRFQMDPPIGSACETYGRIPIEILFPEQVEYHSEGREIALKCPKPIRKAEVIVTTTCFLRSGMCVWHITISPRSGETFSEFDIIKLIHMYDGRSERTLLSDVIKFRLEDSRVVSPAALLTALKLEVTGELSLRAGTVEILTESVKSKDVSHDALLETVMDARENGGESLNRLREWMDGDKTESRVLCAYCGIVTGILDFDHLDEEEVMDSLAPMVPDSGGLMRIHRCTLSSILPDDRIMRECWDDVGISPYLIIPHAVIIHNEALSDAAESTIDESLSIKRPQTSDLEDAHARAEEYLYRLYLPNIFNYDTERELFEKGVITRGSADRYAATTAKLHELHGRINALWETRRDRGQMAIAVMLALISVFQLKDIVFDLVGKRLTDESRWALLLCLAALFAFLMIRFWRMGMRR